MSSIYKNGRPAEAGDYVKFVHDGEVHFGQVKVVYDKTSSADIVHVIHAPKAVEREVTLADCELVHRHEENRREEDQAEAGVE